MVSERDLRKIGKDLLEKIRQMEGTQELIDEYGRVGHKGKMALLLEREVGDRVDECVIAEEEGTGLQ